MAYRIAVLDDDTRELDRTVEMLSLYGETHPLNELQIMYFQEVKPFMEAVCSGNVKEGWAFEILSMDVSRIEKEMRNVPSVSSTL